MTQLCANRCWLAEAMTPIACRTPGRPEASIDELGRCPACRARYRPDRCSRALAGATRRLTREICSCSVTAEPATVHRRIRRAPSPSNRGRVACNQEIFGGACRSLGSWLALTAMHCVCRTVGCPGADLDELGYCLACRTHYDQRRRDTARVGERLRTRHWRLFAALSDEQADDLAGHAAGNLLVGRPQIGWAIGDMLAEARDRAVAAMPPAPPRLRVIKGGRS